MKEGGSNNCCCTLCTLFLTKKQFQPQTLLICSLCFRGHQAAVLCVQFNETKIVSGSCDKAIKVCSEK